MTLFIEKSYVVAAMMKVNRKYFNENYVTKRDMNVLIWKIQKIFNDNNIDALFINKIDCNYFNELESIILLYDDNDFDMIEDRYKSYLPNKVLSIIWNEDFLLSNIKENYEKEREEKSKILRKSLN